ncbi:MAG: hypothetical protein Q7T38_05630 [Gallionella sp.]|nr:hypothetical protein [Gallionella sp.]
MWLVYGILLESWPIIIANCVTLLLGGHGAGNEAEVRLITSATLNLAGRPDY